MLTCLPHAYPAAEKAYTRTGHVDAALLQRKDAGKR
jgi:hypothetical protein